MMSFKELPSDIRLLTWNEVSKAYSKYPGRKNKRKAIKTGKKMLKPLIKNYCKSKGMGSIVTMILVSVAAKLLAALIVWLIKEAFTSVSSEQGYPAGAPGYSRDMFNG